MLDVLFLYEKLQNIQLNKLGNYEFEILIQKINSNFNINFITGKLEKIDIFKDKDLPRAKINPVCCIAQNILAMLEIIRHDITLLLQDIGDVKEKENA